MAARLLHSGTIEHKRDYKAFKTGNVFIELSQQLFSGERVSSGINVTTADFWMIEFQPERWVIIKTEHLRKLVERAFWNNGCREVPGGDNDRYNGVLVPLLSIFKEV